jgi:hypothetical protein
MAPPAPSSQPDREGNDAVRLDLARLVEMETPGVATLLLHGDPWEIAGRVDVHPAVAQLVHEALPIIGRLCRDGRLVSRDEVIAFRFLATRCAHAGIECKVAAQTVSNAAEAVLDAVLRRAHELDDLWGATNVEATTAVLCGVLENFAGRAAAQVKEGYATYQAGFVRARDKDPIRYVRVLDTDVDVSSRDRTSRAILVMLAAGHRDDAAALSTAAREIEVHVPGAVDLGVGSEAMPTHRRVVVPVRDDAAWRGVHPILRHIAVVHGVVIVTRPPVSGLWALRDCYTDLCGSLREIVRTSGRRSGLVAAEDTPTPTPSLTAAA